MGLVTSEIDTRALVPVCRQLSTAYNAGIPITRAIDFVGKQSKDRKVRQVLGQIQDDLTSGSTLGDALGNQSRYLPNFFVNLVSSGETGGQLDVMLDDLADYYEDKLKMQRSFVSAMIYPVLLLVAGWFIGTFAMGMLGVALDAFETGSGGGVTGISDYAGEYVAFQARAIGIFAALAIAGVLLARAGLLRWIYGAISTFVWPLRGVTRKFALARFFRSLSLLLGSGVSVVPALRNAAAASSNPYMERDLLRTVPAVRDGATLSEALAQTRMVTRMGHEMLAVGEESGKLDFQLRKAAEYYAGEAGAAAKRLTVTFTTLIMLVVFGMVGAIIISFYARLYGGLMDGLGI